MARTLLAGLLALYGAWLVLDYQWHFVDGANLLFHEAGHVFFGLLGPTLGILGGTLGQLFFPIACCAHFLRRASVAEASVAVVWLGENLMNVAIYVADARAQVLPRVGGDIHDWHWLLSRWGLLAHDAGVARAVHVLGAAVVIAGVAIAFAAAAAQRRESAAAGSGAEA
jgi:hypothetical protein